ncbi:hypothetical protein J2W48_001275 [Flavobacterium piscis]|uniref:Uncharacterized protein n=1 Tax=Flavobacterium piscis TaxID=1114874 RepID=A0ABU1Y541_9FLAO|nr:hypothetical protein [Flavobacterium piscis]
METNKDLILRNIKDFTDLLFFRFSTEKNSSKKIAQSEKTLELNCMIFIKISPLFFLWKYNQKINILKNILI